MPCAMPEGGRTARRVKVGYVRIKEVRGRVRIEPLSREELERLLRGGADAGKAES